VPQAVNLPLHGSEACHARRQQRFRRFFVRVHATDTVIVAAGYVVVRAGFLFYPRALCLGRGGGVWDATVLLFCPDRWLVIAILPGSSRLRGVGISAPALGSAKRKVEVDGFCRRGRRSLWCRLMDDFAGCFSAGAAVAGSDMLIRVYRRRSAMHSQPVSGGDHAAGEAYYFYGVAAPWGLLERWSAADLTQTVRHFTPQLVRGKKPEVNFLGAEPAIGTAIAPAASTGAWDGIFENAARLPGW